jgi:hypothetical protein
MDATELLTEYAQATLHGEAPAYLRAFLVGLEEASGGLEAARVVPATDKAADLVVLAAARGLAVIRVEYEPEQRRPGLWSHKVTASLWDWRSVRGATVAYLGDSKGEDSRWTLTVPQPEPEPELLLSSGDRSDRDGAKTRALAGTILGHLSAG